MKEITIFMGYNSLGIAIYKTVTLGFDSFQSEVVEFGFFDNNRVYIWDRERKDAIPWVAEHLEIITKVENLHSNS